jgi:hypothetical protein
MQALSCDDILRNQCGVASLRYIGRDASATPATGSKKVSEKQLEEKILTPAIGPVGAGKVASGSSPKTKA